MTHGLLFPKHFFGNGADEMFIREAEAAINLGIPVAYFSQEDLAFTGGIKLYNIDCDVDSYVYRGWMVTENEYERLSTAVEKRGTSLTVPTGEFFRSHLFVNWYPVFHELTFNSVILNDPEDEAEIIHAAQQLNSEKFFVKDLVKSSSETSIAAGINELYNSVEAFVKEKSDDGSLVGNIVVRKFESLDNTQAELRSWWVDGKLVFCSTHPNFIDRGNIPTFVVDSEFGLAVADAVRKLAAKFIVVDFAVKANGDFIIVEVGNGQVSGLPANLTDTDLDNLLTALTK